MSSVRYFALIPAAGVGARMQADCPKQYLPLLGKPMLLHALETLAGMPDLAGVALVVSPEDAWLDSALALSPGIRERVQVLRVGGATRLASVRNGLRALQAQLQEEDWVMVHDAARPGLTPALVRHLMRTLDTDPVGGLLALPVVDTLKRAGSDTRSLQTVSREHLWAAQTPQMFRYGLLCRALDQAVEVTDEASAVEALGLQPRLVEGSPRNFKVTLPQDVALAELYLKGLT